jgi:hypothetical protein
MSDSFNLQPDEQALDLVNELQFGAPEDAANKLSGVVQHEINKANYAHAINMERARTAEVIRRTEASNPDLAKDERAKKVLEHDLHALQRKDLAKVLDLASWEEQNGRQATAQEIADWHLPQRIVRRWLEGTRPTPEAVIEYLRALADALDQTAQAITMSRGGPAVLLLYRRDRDVPAWTGLRTAGCHLALVRRVFERRPDIQLIAFDRVPYRWWLRDRTDSEEMRDAWAASRV